MPAQLLDGRKIAKRLRERLREAREAFGDRAVRLVSLEIGANPAAANFLPSTQILNERLVFLTVVVDVVTDIVAFISSPKFFVMAEKSSHPQAHSTNG